MNVLASCVFAAWRQLSLSAISQGNGKGTHPFPTEGKPKLDSARSHESLALCQWLKGQKRQEELFLCYCSLLERGLQCNPSMIL